MLSALLSWQPMKRNELRSGVQYLAVVGGWIYEIECIERSTIYYTVLQTDQHCQTTPANFAERVLRPITLIAEPNRRR